MHHVSKSFGIALFMFGCCLFVATLSAAQSKAVVYQLSKGGTAIDVRGIRHWGREYPKYRAPWNFADRLAAVAPEYPTLDRHSHHRGVGFFRIFIDPTRGTVSNVAILKSTGYASLDNDAVAALRHWRWKAGTWKEVDLPVEFRLTLGPPPNPPAGSIPLIR